MGITGANFMVAESGTVDRARERGQRPARLVAAPLPRRARGPRARPRDDRRRRVHGRAALARGRRPRAAELRLVAQRPRRRRRRRPRGVRRDRSRQRPLARARERRARDPQLHPLRLVPDGLPGLLQGRRARLRLGLRRADRRGADAAADRTCSPDEGRKLPFLSSLCGACTDACPVGIPLHDMLVRDRALANRAGVASRSERAAWGAWARAWSSPRLYRASARAGARSGPFARAFGPGCELARRAARRCRCRARKPFHRRWSDLESERVIDAFIAALAGRRRRRRCASPTSAAARAHVADAAGPRRDALLLERRSRS